MSRKHPRPPRRNLAPKKARRPSRRKSPASRKSPAPEDSRKRRGSRRLNPNGSKRPSRREVPRPLRRRSSLLPNRLAHPPPSPPRARARLRRSFAAGRLAIGYHHRKIRAGEGDRVSSRPPPPPRRGFWPWSRQSGELSLSNQREHRRHPESAGAARPLEIRHRAQQRDATGERARV